MKTNPNALNVTRPVKFTEKDFARINIRAEEMRIPSSHIIRYGTLELLDRYDDEDKLSDEKELVPPKTNVEVNPQVDQTTANNTTVSKTEETEPIKDEALTFFDDLFN